MTTEEFEIVPPGKIATLFPLLIGGILPLLLLAAMGFAAHRSGNWLLQTPPLLILPLVAGVMAWTMHGRRIQVSDQGLRVRLLPWPRPIKLSELVLEQARIVNLAEHPELQPVLRIAGSRLPGFRTGLFRLRDRRRATVLLTDLNRVLVIPRNNGSVILLSPQRPEALLDALKRHPG